VVGFAYATTYLLCACHQAYHPCRRDFHPVCQPTLRAAAGSAAAAGTRPHRLRSRPVPGAPAILGGILVLGATLARSLWSEPQNSPEKRPGRLDRNAVATL